jgi:hypothetical protein
VRGSDGGEAGRRNETTKDDGAKRKKEEDDWVRSWFGKQQSNTPRRLLTGCHCAMVKSERQEKRVREGKTYRHCSLTGR